MDPQHPAHGPDTELCAMRPDEGVLHWDPRTKYALIGHSGQFACEPPVLGLVVNARLPDRLPKNSFYLL